MCVHHTAGQPWPGGHLGATSLSCRPEGTLAPVNQLFAFITFEVMSIADSKHVTSITMSVHGRGVTAYMPTSYNTRKSWLWDICSSPNNRQDSHIWSMYLTCSWVKNSKLAFQGTDWWDAIIHTSMLITYLSTIQSIGCLRRPLLYHRTHVTYFR